MKKICVIGSINTDLVVRVDQFPKPGETIIGQSFAAYPGGKGANQAVAASRLGADVLMVGKLGDDAYGEKYLEVFKENQVGFQAVGIERGVSSGFAVIAVNQRGENNIVIIPGANGQVDLTYIDQKWQEILEYDIFMIQLEIPIDTVWATIKRLKSHGKIIILDPAPALKIPQELFSYIDFITPNETEMQIISGREIRDTASLQEAAMSLIDQGVHGVIAKMGKNGAYVVTGETMFHVAGFEVDTIDTTAAGDSFNAGFAVALSQGRDLRECVLFANGVGALATTGLGAQSAMPTLYQVERLIERQGSN